MARSFDIALTNSRGFGKVVFFSGLEFPMVLTPSLLGAPMITAQAFYFLERMDAVARVRFEPNQTIPSEREIEYIIDCYLFEYSKLHADSRLTSKIVEGVYWREDPQSIYTGHDWLMTECIALDTLNDESIIECSDPYHPNKDCFYDWCLMQSYFQEAFDAYQSALCHAMDIKVHVKTVNHERLGSGEYDLPIIQVQGTPLTLTQAEMFEVISPHEPRTDSLTYSVSRGMDSSPNFVVPQELVRATKHYNEQLLAYYFCALRDSSPVSEFKNYYNVLEFFFEDAPLHLGIKAKTEKEQIDAVLHWLLSSAELLNQLNRLPSEVVGRITKSRATSSGEVVPGVNLRADDLLAEYASHIYQLRNACIHSKRTRMSLPTPRIVPSMAEEQILADEISMMKWLAAKCIEK